MKQKQSLYLVLSKVSWSHFKVNSFICGCVIIEVIIHFFVAVQNKKDNPTKTELCIFWVWSIWMNRNISTQCSFSRRSTLSLKQIYWCCSVFLTTLSLNTDQRRMQPGAESQVSFQWIPDASFTLFLDETRDVNPRPVSAFAKSLFCPSHPHLHENCFTIWKDCFRLLEKIMSVAFWVIRRARPSPSEHVVCTFLLIKSEQSLAFSVFGSKRSAQHQRPAARSCSTSAHSCGGQAAGRGTLSAQQQDTGAAVSRVRAGLIERRIVTVPDWYRKVLSGTIGIKNVSKPGAKKTEI